MAIKKFYLVLFFTITINFIFAQNDFNENIPSMEGEWIAVYGVGNYDYAHHWIFKDNQVNTIEKRKWDDSTFTEYYTWKVKGKFLQFITKSYTVDYDILEVKENYLLLHINNLDIVLVRKSIITHDKKYEKNKPDLHQLMTGSFKLKTNIDSLKQRYITIKTIKNQGVFVLNDNNCLDSGNIEISQGSYADVIRSNKLGVFLIERNDTYKFRGISLSNQRDTIYFNRLLKEDNILDSLPFPINIKKIKSNSSKRSISVGMPKMILQKDGKGIIRIGNIGIYFFWKYSGINLIKIEPYRKRLIKKPTEREQIFFDSNLNIQDFATLFIVSKSENGKILLKSSNCDGIMYEVLD